MTEWSEHHICSSHGSPGRQSGVGNALFLSASPIRVVQGRDDRKTPRRFPVLKIEPFINVVVFGDAKPDRPRPAADEKKSMGATTGRARTFFGNWLLGSNVAS